MDSWALIVLLMIAIIGIGIAAGAARQRAIRRRAAALGSLATSQGWSFAPSDPSYLDRWDGAPFQTFGRRGVRHVVTGTHRGRPFAAFEYWYVTTRRTRNNRSTTTHTYTVWAVGLPSAVPKLSVGSEGVFGGKIAEAFGFERVNIEDESFNDTFKVKSDDQQFGLAVLSPAVLEMLRYTGPWDWRFTGDTMISYVKGAFEAEVLMPRLEMMCDLLDRIPQNVLQHRPAP